MTSRRRLVLAALPAAALAAAVPSVPARQPARVPETDDADVAPGYRRESTRVDRRPS